ncbi:vomeronasal type-1 receptor 90-like [Suricata suricatta]|uniref:vomeronasal type-1 receptor 90-like n=1 Tax=Suricata suricatta TaxID=37032 RepID=UPI001155F872|nr:vomeronasal type-1 receptor 90-like [Suricata suricatta]
MTIKIRQFLQVGIGISANTFLLLFHIFTLLLDHRYKPTDLATCHLAFVHMMKLFTVLFLLSTDLLESLNFLSDFKCKALFYMIRVTRGLSMGNTCLLSMLQAIIVSPSTSWMARFKHKCTQQLFHPFIILWFLSLSLNSPCIFYFAAPYNVTQSNLLTVSKYCSAFRISSIFKGLLLTLTLSRDVFFIEVMLLSSAYMVVLLSRHQRRCRHLHSTRLSSRVSPERRATQTVLLLVSFFVVVYWLDVIAFAALLWSYGPVILDVQRLVSNVYATVSALVLISSGKRVKMCFKSVEQ